MPKRPEFTAKLIPFLAAMQQCLDQDMGQESNIIEVNYDKRTITKTVTRTPENKYKDWSISSGMRDFLFSMKYETQPGWKVYFRFVDDHEVIIQGFQSYALVPYKDGMTRPRDKGVKLWYQIVVKKELFNLFQGKNKDDQ